MTNKKIPANIRQTVWNTYIGENIGKIKCPMCQQNDIQPFQFHCGHVIARSKGGQVDASNLRPICSLCNNSMYNHNMIEFAQAYYPNSPLHKTFENIQLRNNIGQIDDSIKSTDISINQSADIKISKGNLKNITELPSHDLNDRTCQFCRNEFKQRCSMLRHIRENKCKSKLVLMQNANNKKKYKCKNCQKAFTRQDNLLRHQKSICTTTPIGENNKESNLLKFLGEQYFKNNAEKMATLEKQINDLNLEKQEIQKQVNELKNSDKRVCV